MMHKITTPVRHMTPLLDNGEVNHRFEECGLTVGDIEDHLADLYLLRDDVIDGAYEFGEQVASVIESIADELSGLTS